MWRRIFNTFLLGILLLSATGIAQEEKLIRAQQLYHSKESSLALAAIDSVIAHPQTSGDFIAWTTRAFIYFDLYKRSDRTKLYSPLRDSIISSLKRSEQLNPDSAFAKQNRSLFNNLAANYFNLAKVYLQDSLNYDKSQYAYSQYKKVYSMVDPSYDYRARDVEFNLATGSHFMEAFFKNIDNTSNAEIAKVSLLKVLDIQPDNPSALINMGLMYYNQAVELTKKVDFGIELDQLDVVQSDIVKLAKQAEQFIVQVYNNDNKNTKAVHALYYIYRMLEQYKKSDEFKAKCKELGVVLDDQANDSK